MSDWSPSSFILLAMSDDGIVFYEFECKKDLLEFINGEDFGEVQYMSTCPQDAGDFYDIPTKALIIEGCIRKPKPKDVVTRYTL